MNLTFRPDTPEDYAERARLWNDYWPGFPRTEEDIRVGDAGMPTGTPYQRWMAERDGKVVGSLAWMKQYWVAVEGPLLLSLMLNPSDDDFVAALQWLEAQAMNAGATSLQTFARDDVPVRLEVFLGQGYAIMDRSPHLLLEVSSFDASPYEASWSALEAEGLRLVTFAELEAEGYDWHRPLYDATTEMIEDIPTAEPMQMESYEDHLKGLDPWHYHPPLMFGVMDGDRLVAYSRLERIRNEPSRVWTAFGGTVRSHRRRGLMLALKAWSMAKARDEHGVRFIATDNVEGNPMRLINDRLGFAHWFDAVKLVKPV